MHSHITVLITQLWKVYIVRHHFQFPWLRRVKKGWICVYEYIIHYSTGSSVSFFRLSGSLNCTLLKAPTIIKKINLNLQEKTHTVTVGVYNIHASDRSIFRWRFRLFLGQCTTLNVFLAG